MKIARRTFLFAAGGFAASPVLAKLLPSARGVAPELPPPAEAADQSGPVFKIYGWSVRDEAASSCNEIWLNVNRSWRTAWR
jgi:hypothetical protein